MLKLHMAACLVATALAAAPALAQSTAPASTGPSGATDRPAATGSGSTTSGSSAMQPSTGASVGTQPATGGAASGAGAATGVSETPASGSAATGSSNNSGSASTSSSASATPPSPTAGASGASSTVAGGSGVAGQVMTHQQPGQWLASKLIGTTVVGPNNESIGDVNDVLMERDGHAAAVIVGVGGFLGIGEKDVAISFDHIELTSRAATNASSAQTTGSTSATSQSSPSTTGSTASATANGVPDRIMLRMTKQELQNAPKFTRADQRDTSGERGTPATAPKQ